MQHDMTQGSVRGHLLRMTGFVLAGLVLQTLYSLVDLYWVGRLGETAVAAVSLATNLMFVALALTQMLAVGTVALVSQAAGRKDGTTVAAMFDQAQSLAIALAIGALLLGWAGSGLYLDALTADPETRRLGAEFMRAYVPALALQFPIVAIGASLRALGDMRAQLAAQFGSILLNMVLAPLLMFGWLGLPALGIFGAGLATLIATGAATLAMFGYVLRGRSPLRLNPPGWWPRVGTWTRILGIGLPSGAEFLLMAVILGLVYAVIAGFGPSAQAGFGIASRIMQAGFMPAVATSFAIAAVVGQNVGAGNADRVRQSVREGAIQTVGAMLIFTLICQFGADAMIGAFTTAPDAVAVGADYLHVVSLNYCLSGLIFTATGVFQGLGNAWPSLLASASRLLSFALPVWWLSRQPGFDLHTVWWLSVASIVLQCALALSLLWRELSRRLQRFVPVTEMT